VVGHKPTHGLVPCTGVFPIEQTIDHVGPMARTVADVALTLAVLAGPDGLDPRQPADVSVPDYVAELGRAADGLRVRVIAEGFGRDNSEPAVDATVRAAAETLAGAGMSAEEVSIPWHLHGLRVWDVIAAEGATAQMIDGNGYGLNWQGRYDPDLIDYYGTRWRGDPTAFSEIVKLVMLAGRYALDRYHGRLRALGPHRRALRQGQGPAGPGRGRPADAVLPRAPRRPAPAAGRPRAGGVRRGGRPGRRAGRP